MNILLIDCLNISTIILQCLFLTILYFWKTCLVFTECVAVTSGNPVPPNVAENPHFLYPVALSAGQACSLLSHLQFHPEKFPFPPRRRDHARLQPGNEQLSGISERLNSCVPFPLHSKLDELNHSDLGQDHLWSTLMYWLLTLVDRLSFLTRQ